MLALVVHNGSHHADNVVRLCEDVADFDPAVRVAVLYDAGETAPPVVGRPDSIVVGVGVPSVGNGDAANAARPSLARAAARAAVRTYLTVRKRVKGQGWVFERLLEAAELNSIVCLLRQRRTRARFDRQIEAVGRVLDRLAPGVVLTWSDRQPDIIASTLVAARRKGIRVVVPYVSFAGVGGMLWARRKYGPHRWTPFSIYRALTGLRLPHAVREDCLFLEPFVMNALESLGALSPNPWCIGCGLSDIVCVDNETTASRYEAEGVPAARLRITGSPDFDTLFEELNSRGELRRRIHAACGWSIGRRLLILALPQFAEQGVLDWNAHWREIRYIVGELARTGCAVLISLHPRMDPAKYAFLEHEFDVRLSVDPLKKILPAADAFVAVNSSTLVWSVLCGIKTFLMDFYGLDSAEFTTFESIRVIGEREQLYDAVAGGLVEDEDFTADWRRLSRDRVFDGSVIARYSDLIRGVATPLAHREAYEHA